jgi:pimeloyl-ACP methyl ester carboxylesterase
MKGFVRQVLLVSLIAVSLSTQAAAADSPDPSGYCVPQNSFFDPTDLGPVVLPPLPPGLRERFVTLAGAGTPLLEAGPRRGSRAVVFVHGNPGSSRDFTELIAASQHLGLRLVAFDMPGFGRAQRLWSFPYTADGYTAWFGRALIQLGIRQAIFVVHDIGGPLAMQWAAAHPRGFLGAVIIDSGVLVGYQDHYLARIWKTPVVGEQFMASTDHESFDVGVENGQQQPLPQPFVDLMYAEYDRVTRCAILGTYRSVSDVDAFARRQSDALRPLKRPALVIWGAHDPYLPTQLAYNQRLTFPSADVHILDNGGHWPFIDDPLQVKRLVVPFLAMMKRRLAHPHGGHRTGDSRNRVTAARLGYQ